MRLNVLIMCTSFTSIWCCIYLIFQSVPAWLCPQRRWISYVGQSLDLIYKSRCDSVQFNCFCITHSFCKYHSRWKWGEVTELGICPHSSVSWRPNISKLPYDCCISWFASALTYTLLVVWPGEFIIEHQYVDSYSEWKGWTSILGPNYWFPLSRKLFYLPRIIASLPLLSSSKSEPLHSTTVCLRNHWFPSRFTDV